LASNLLVEHYEKSKEDSMLNEEQFSGKWKEIKGGIRNLWGRITDDELDQMKGNLSEVSGLVEERYGETKEDIKEKLTHLMSSFDNDTDKNISPDVTSYERSPLGTRTAESSQKQDSDINTRSEERKAFDSRTYERSQDGNSNYSGANPNREDFDSDRNARH
jgi:uncharacterized protein YjbJ (UPF0337 family)